MGESEFLAQADATLSRIALALDELNDEGMIDVECSRSGNVLEIEFIDNGSKIIVNSQAAMQEMWVASRSGGYHYRQRDGKWRNTRDDSELFSALSEMVSAQGGSPVCLECDSE
ncbi:iron donor protein CyaY [Duganella qianjiadongensis]|uniref:Iron-sulfur cluster assembly protein CyaY n=1 Tax=Duganella qianjiadongensis TaxID=2692176 RepID=A0ABW9VPY3_9BURK|nr:iron donor protein CyaY [Duganella qianjiadongensis]MYM41629.1 iron donor protein CyaY [Duganella qianjiadongensis]